MMATLSLQSVKCLICEHLLGSRLLRSSVAAGMLIVISTHSVRGQHIRPPVSVWKALSPAQEEETAESNPEVPSTGATHKPDADPLADALCRLKFDRSSAHLIEQWSRGRLPAADEEKATTTDATVDPSQPNGPMPAQLALQMAMSRGDIPEGALPPEVRAMQQAMQAQQTGQPQRKLDPELQRKVDDFQRAVVLGEWQTVQQVLQELSEKGRERVYDHLLAAIGRPVAEGPNLRRVQMSGMGGEMMVVDQSHDGQRNPPRCILAPSDLHGIIHAAPCQWNDARIKKLAELWRIVRDNGNALDELTEQLREGVGGIGGADANERYKLARLYLLANELTYAESVLPDWDDPSVRDDPYAVEILADYYQAKYAEDKKVETLSRSWEIHQWLSGMPGIPPPILERALSRLIEMSKWVDQELGRQWLEASFDGDATRGIRLLTIFGAQTARNLQQGLSHPKGRLITLRLQHLAAETLVKTMAEDHDDWQSILTRLSEIWLREAELADQFTRDTSPRMQMQWDAYGNIYYANPEEMAQMHMHYAPHQPQPIPIVDLLELLPGQRWLDRIDPTLRPAFAAWTARLHLKNNDEAAAFPFIEQLADHQPQVARDLVHRFLTVWTRNHDPNANRRMYNPYIVMYGYNTQAEGIPLTRSKQQRNLAELQHWLARIRAMKIEPIDESHLVSAFTKCHSSAEVYQLAAFEEVFGDIGSLKPKTVADIAHSMRTNLSSVWRKVAVQEQWKTRRKEKDIQAEVLRGYDVAMEVARRALTTANDERWRLQLVLAALEFDRNAYQQTFSKSTEFADNRREAFTQFAAAADSYAQVVGELDQSLQSMDPYTIWFYAALGSSELSGVSHENVPDSSQFALIRQCLERLTPSARDYHVGEFAGQLFTRMSNVQPQVKFRYIRGGMEIIGDHPRAREARRSLDYYTDIIREIRLGVRIDGSDRVGHDQPFGLLVSFLHTSAMERESGGFEKYVQNQNAGYVMYNYGRPPENYRDKFQEATNKALEEHFEVLAITFEDAKHMRSRPALEAGWRETPYAYVLVKPRGPQVDMIAPLKLDLDFLDATGFVVLPIESPSIPIDASGKMVDARPARKLKITQTLDERQADQGKLVLEVKASAVGLVPPLEQLLELKFESMQVQHVDDQGVNPTEFDTTEDEIAIRSDRSWTVELTEAPNAESRMTSFAFCPLKYPEAENLFQRYDDVDLVPAESTITLARAFGGGSWTWTGVLLYSLAVICGMVASVMGIRLWFRPSSPDRRNSIPADTTPFTALAYLRRMGQQQQDNGTSSPELLQTIDRIEREYFARGNGRPGIDLQQLLQEWVERSPAHRRS